MRVIILQVNRVEKTVLDEIKSRLPEAFPRSTCTVVEEVLPVPQTAYNHSREQYHSSIILHEILNYAERSGEMADRILGVTEVDLYVPGMNFIFGEAQCPGRAAIISLQRLRPEFYGEPSDERLFLERSVKEALHEIGHTLGLGHCTNPLCVMFFSLHIGMTDRKQPRFCEKCRLKVEKIL